MSRIEALLQTSTEVGRLNKKFTGNEGIEDQYPKLHLIQIVGNAVLIFMRSSRSCSSDDQTTILKGEQNNCRSKSLK